jgi:hypothetical protein
LALLQFSNRKSKPDGNQKPGPGLRAYLAVHLLPENDFQGETMFKYRSTIPIGALLAIASLSAIPARAQGSKTLMDWLQQYSPTGYFILHDYERLGGKPDDYKQFLPTTASPAGGVAVHETCHMRNGKNSQNNQAGYFIGAGKDIIYAKTITMFNSQEILPDIPDSMVNFQTDVYISGKAGPGAVYSMVAGLYGIFEEYDAYVTELKSGAEMAPCFKANFNTAKDWGDFTNDNTTAVWSNSEFRYFCLRYILCAQKKHAAIYNQIMASKDIRECYTDLVRFAELAMKEWMAALQAQKLDTKTKNGFDEYWKYWNEIQKPEYQDLEKNLLTAPLTLAWDGKAGLRALPATLALPGGFDALGRSPGQGRLPARLLRFDR